MIGRLLRLLGLLVVVSFCIYLFRSNVVGNASKTVLGSLNRSSAYGSAQLVPAGQGSSEDLQVNLQGLNSNLHYVVALQQGGCAGPVLKIFGGSVDANGNSSSVTSLSDIPSTAKQNLWVNVHRDTISGTSVACGQVQVDKQLVAQVTNTVPTSTSVPVATPRPTPTPTPATDTTGISTNNPTTTGDSVVHDTTRFPRTGVAPAQGSDYDNYTYPRKY